jgi:hypothetical protein
MTIGRSVVGVTASYLNGGVSAVLAFSSAHTRSEVDLISSYLKEEFNVL